MPGKPLSKKEKEALKKKGKKSSSIQRQSASAARDSAIKASKKLGKGGAGQAAKKLRGRRKKLQEALNF
jgi:hypothetical protein